MDCVYGVFRMSLLKSKIINNEYININQYSVGAIYECNIPASS